jgi:hypothetical protein
MNNTARMCQIASCKREAATLCYHCQQEVCHTHFNQHSSMIMTDVYSLADQINILNDDITALSIAQIRNSLFNQLQQWRDESINIIENIYIQKQVELNERICQLDIELSLAKTEKQQEVSQIKKKITELIDTGEATFAQMNRLQKSVDQVVLDVDKLRTKTIRIENQQANLDTCRIISMDQILHTQSEDVSVSISKIHINDDVKHSNKPDDQFHSSTSQSRFTIGNGGSESSSPIVDSLTTPYPSYDIMPGSLSLPSPPPLLELSVPTQMPYPYQQQPSFMPPSYFTYESSPHTIELPYPPSESSSSTHPLPEFSHMNQLPLYTGRNSTEYSPRSSIDSDV